MMCARICQRGGGAQDGEVLIDTHGKYLDSPRNVAKELDVPFVDMNKITHDLVQRMGPEASKKLFMWIPEGVCAACPKGREDNTHFSAGGNDDRFLDLDVVDGAADKSGEGEIQEFASEFQ